MNHPQQYPEAKRVLLVFQVFTSAGWLLVTPWLYLRFILKKPITSLFDVRDNTGILLGITGLIVLSFMFVNAVVIEWNQNIVFPEQLDWFAEWARGLEDRFKVLTEYLTRFDNTGQFLLGLLAIAVVPALGEELVFRGIFQNLLRELTGRHHLAIWLSAMLFSLIHFQFFGFVPRMLLGALFGYLYLWSGTLWVPVFAHFINNGFTLTMFYLYQRGMSRFNIEEEQAPAWYVSLVFAVVVIVLLYIFRKKANESE